MDSKLPQIFATLVGADGKKTDVHVTIHAGAETIQTAGYAGVFRKLGVGSRSELASHLLQARPRGG